MNTEISSLRLAELKNIAENITIDELMLIVGVIGLNSGRDCLIDRIQSNEWDALTENNPQYLTEFAADFMCDVINVQEVTDIINLHQLANEYVVDFNVVIK